jgi:hypothetical protein
MILDELPDEGNLCIGDVTTSIAPLCFGRCSHLIRSMPETVSERK